MADAATMAGSRLTLGKRADRRSFRELAAADFARAKGYAPWPSQVDRLEAMGRHLRWLLDHEGDAVIRSFPQIFRALGLPCTGNVKVDRARHRSTTARRLNDMVAMGWLEGWQPVLKSNGEGRGILLRVRRDSSVGEAHPSSFRRPPRTPRRPACIGSSEPPRRRRSSRGELVSPLRENCTSTSSETASSRRRSDVSTLRNGRRARHARGGAPPDAVTALRTRFEAGQQRGSAIVAALPWLADLEPSVLLRSAAAAAGIDQRASGDSRRLVESAAATLDHFDGRGAGAAAIIELAAGGWRQHRFASRSGSLEAPLTAGGLAKPLRQRARMARRVAAFRNGLL